MHSWGGPNRWLVAVMFVSIAGPNVFFATAPGHPVRDLPSIGYWPVADAVVYCAKQPQNLAISSVTLQGRNVSVQFHPALGQRPALKDIVGCVRGHIFRRSPIREQPTRRSPSDPIVPTSPIPLPHYHRLEANHASSEAHVGPCCVEDYRPFRIGSVRIENTEDVQK